MKNKAFNQTVAFTSASMDFSQKESKEAYTLDSSMEDKHTDTNEEEVEREEQQLITPVPNPQLNIALSHKFNSQEDHTISSVDDHQPLDNTFDGNEPDQKVYDRFKRTVEINTLELFDGDSNSTGAAWMIRDKDDVIEHRERLGLDNSEFYQDNSNAKKIAIIVILASMTFVLWYLLMEL